MAMLECPGVFTMPFVPEGWTATADGDSFFELQPPDRSAALHISVYRRQPTELKPGQAEGYLGQFVNRQPPLEPPRIVRVPADTDEQRVFAKYRHVMGDGEVTEWFVGCILWPSAMLMCSSNAAPGAAALADSELAIASIFQGTEPG